MYMKIPAPAAELAAMRQNHRESTDRDIKVSS